MWSASLKLDIRDYEGNFSAFFSSLFNCNVFLGILYLEPVTRILIHSCSGNCAEILRGLIQFLRSEMSRLFVDFSMEDNGAFQYSLVYVLQRWLKENSYWYVIRYSELYFNVIHFCTWFNIPFHLWKYK